MTPEEHRRFVHLAPVTERRIQDHQAVRAALIACAEALGDVVPAGRERALALTKLEEALFWANAGVARAEVTE